jgi:hypothetical protein
VGGCIVICNTQVSLVLLPYSYYSYFLPTATPAPLLLGPNSPTKTEDPSPPTDVAVLDSCMSANHVRKPSHLQRNLQQQRGGKTFSSLHMHIPELSEVRWKIPMWFKVLTVG